MATPRQIVAQALCKMDKNASWSNLVLDTALKQFHLSAQDSAFASALFYGVLERRITLDACIAAHSSVPLKKLSVMIRNILRIGVYQLLYLDSVPDSAAVSQSVELAKSFKLFKSTGFVNGVLRAFLRAGKQIPVPEGAGNAKALSILYSCPEPLVALWIAHYGEEAAEHILAHSLGRPPVSIRVNTLKTTPGALARSLEAKGIGAIADEELEQCLFLSHTGSVSALPEYQEGLFHVQDKSSQLCALALGAAPGMQVLDACAAPGGKAFSIAQHMENKGSLTAAELHPQRVRLMQQRAQELGISIINALQRDMAAPQNDLGLFDRVLCDVPCSGLGVIRRKPEIKYKPLAEYEKIPIFQYKILENSSHYCKSGGLLLYSTCTLNPAENEKVVRQFLVEHPGFSPYPLPELLGGGHMHTILGQSNADGFFMALFQKTSP